jgi:hypothetical protein
MPEAVPGLPSDHALRYIYPVKKGEENGRRILCEKNGLSFVEHNSETFLDMFDAVAMDHYLKVCYEDMWAEFSDEYGKTVLSVWVDEPSYNGAYLPYTGSLEALFEKRYGYTLADKVWMLYYDGEYVRGAALECVEYVMANTAPSRVTGNTHFGRFLNEDRINEFCDSCIKYLEKKLGVPAHGILSFDLKEDKDGNMKVTEVNIRHMAYTGVMSQVGFDLIEDTIKIMEDGNCDRVERTPFYHYDKPYIFLRDVDVEPIVLDGEDVFDKVSKL